MGVLLVLPRASHSRSGISTASAAETLVANDGQAGSHRAGRGRSGINVDPALVKAVISTESGWNPQAVSNKGAVGLMQLIPGTAQRFGVGNAFDPAQNVEGGTTYLKSLLDRYNGDLSKTLAAYNAGEHAVDQIGGVPAYRETQRYVQKVTTHISAPVRAATRRSGVRQGIRCDEKWTEWPGGFHERMKVVSASNNLNRPVGSSLALGLAAARSAAPAPRRSQEAMRAINSSAPCGCALSLEGYPQKDRSLSDYKQTVAAYHKVYLITPEAEEVTPSLIAEGELYQAMGRQFDPKYFQSAIESYNFLLKQYPGSRYRQHALFSIGKVQKDDLKQAGRALKLLQGISEALSKIGPGERREAWP